MNRVAITVKSFGKSNEKMIVNFKILFFQLRTYLLIFYNICRNIVNRVAIIVKSVGKNIEKLIVNVTILFFQ